MIVISVHILNVSYHIWILDVSYLRRAFKHSNIQSVGLLPKLMKYNETIFIICFINKRIRYSMIRLDDKNENCVARCEKITDDLFYFKNKIMMYYNIIILVVFPVQCWTIIYYLFWRSPWFPLSRYMVIIRPRVLIRMIKTFIIIFDLYFWISLINKSLITLNINCVQLLFVGGYYD